MYGARSWTDRRGFSIPMVLLFCAIMVVVLLAFIQTRINMKAQTRLSFRQLKAHYLAQSGIQHALLKLRVLPNESYDAAAVARGVCPFLQLPGGVPYAGAAPPGGDIILQEFIRDVDTKDTTFGWPITMTDFPNWHYTATSVKALMANKEGATAGAEAQTHAIEITCEGELNENYKGQALTTTDIVTRIVKITRSR